MARKGDGLSGVAAYHEAHQRREGAMKTAEVAVMAWRVIVLMVSIGVVSLAQAGQPLLTSIKDVDGNTFLEECRGKAGGQGFCLGYVTGLSDGLGLMQGMDREGLTLAPVCAPTKATYGQKHDVIVRYLEEHPEARHLVIAGLAIMAWRAAWPCTQ